MIYLVEMKVFLNITNYFMEKVFPNSSKTQFWTFCNIFLMLVWFIFLLWFSICEETINHRMLSAFKVDVDNLKVITAFFATGLISIYIFVIPRIIDEFNKFSQDFKLKGLQVLRKDHIVRMFVFFFPMVTLIVLAKWMTFGISEIDFLPVLLIVLQSIISLVFFVLYLFWIISDRPQYVIFLNRQILKEYEQG